MQNIFLLIHQKCSKINGANLRPGGLLYYSLCQNNKTFQAWLSLFHKHTPSKILMNKYFHTMVWWFYFNEISNCCFFPGSLFIPTALFTNFGDFCQPPRLLHPPPLLFWPKFTSLPVNSAFPFYLKLESKHFLNWNYSFQNKDQKCN